MKQPDTFASTAFRMPTRVHIESGCLARLPTLVQETLAEVQLETAPKTRIGSGVMLVLDPGLGQTPWPERVTQDLEAAGCRLSRFDAVEPNPRAATAEAIAEQMRADGCTLVVGLGGGSVLDAAKAAALLAGNGGRCLDYEGKDQAPSPSLPMIAVPTTCGTGSEVTWVSVISVPERQSKISIKGESMFPRHAVVDADLIATLPPALIASTSLDALTHALEALTVRQANRVSDALAERAVGLILTYLRRAVADPAGDREAREAVMTASTLAGLAFGNADVGAVHCLSEALGGLYDVPHGLANALLLVPVLRDHGSAVATPLAAVSRRVLQSRAADAPAAAELLDAVSDLVDALDLPAFADFGVPATDHTRIAQLAEANGSNASNPRPMVAADYRRILSTLS